MGEVDEGADEGCGGVGCEGVVEEAAPHGALGEDFEGEGGYDAEVVAAAAEGEEEGWVGRGCDGCYGSVGEDKLGMYAVRFGRLGWE